MPDYRRARHSGGTYFFTLTLLRRRNNDLLTRHIERLRDAVRTVRRAHPFDIHGWADWPYSTFHRLVSQGIYPLEWAGSDGAEALGYPD